MKKEKRNLFFFCFTSSNVDERFNFDNNDQIVNAKPDANGLNSSL